MATMQEQQQAIAQIAQLIHKSSSLLECDASCQHAKKENELKQRMELAETRIHSAPQEYQLRRRQYVEFTKGEAYYTELRETERAKSAEQITQNIASAFQSQADATNAIGIAYDTAVQNAQKTDMLQSELNQRAMGLKSHAVESRDIIVTNERKTWYESTGIDAVRWRYKILRTIYLVVAFAFIIAHIYASKSAPVATQIAYTLGLGFILLIWLPFSHFTLLRAIWAWIGRVAVILFPGRSIP